MERLELGKELLELNRVAGDWRVQDKRGVEGVREREVKVLSRIQMSDLVVQE